MSPKLSLIFSLVVQFTQYDNIAEDISVSENRYSGNRR